MGRPQQSYNYDHRKNSDWLNYLCQRLAERGVEIPYAEKMMILNRIQFSSEYWAAQGEQGIDFENAYSNKRQNTVAENLETP